MSDSAKACQECGHGNYVHVNWVGSCAVYTKGKRCPCGVYRDTKLSFTPDPEVSWVSSTDPDYWMRYRKADLVAQIAAEEALGRNTGLLHAAKRMVAHLEGQTNMQDYPKPEPITIKSYDTTETTVCANPDCRPWVHPAYLCPKRITADKENTLGKNKDDDWDKLSEWDRMRQEIADLGERLTQRENAHRNLHASLEATDREVYGLRADHDLMRNFVHRQNVEANKRLDDLTGRMGAREDAAHSLVEALDDVNKNLNTTDECVNVLSSRVYTLEDRLSPPSDESPTDRIAQQDDEPHGIGLDGRCEDCDDLVAEPVMSNQERIDLIGRWMHPGLWSAMDGRREAILKILGGQHVEPNRWLGAVVVGED